MDIPSVYTLKAFSIIAALIDNTREVVAPIGELSPIAMTYAREKEYLTTGTAPGNTLVVFSSKRDGEVEQTDPVLASALLSVNKWLYEQALSGVFNSSSDSVRRELIREFGDLYSVWTVGAMVLAQPNVWMPSFLDLRSADNDDEVYRIWYSTEVFEQQYDEFDLKIVPPVADLDVFFETRIDIDNALKAMSHDKTIDLIMEAKEGYPETFLETGHYEWFDPINPTDPELRIDTYWTAVGYGIAGRNDDSIKEAIREYILANSDYGKDDWATIFPEIFTSTEFVFAPLWNKYSIPNRALESGLYSSVAGIVPSLNHLKTWVRGEGYTDEYMEEFAELFGFGYKGVSVPVIGGPHNRDGINTITLRYPDYMNVDTTSVDFGRMGPETRRFVLTLSEMLAIAEDMGPDTSVPVGYTRLFREGVLYVSRTLDRFQLIVASKYSTELEVVEPPVAPS